MHVEPGVALIELLGATNERIDALVQGGQSETMYHFHSCWSSYTASARLSDVPAAQGCCLLIMKPLITMTGNFRRSTHPLATYLIHMHHDRLCTRKNVPFSL